MLKKYAFLMALAAVSFGFSACTEDVDYTPAQATDPNCMEVYFDMENETSYSYDVEADASSVVIPVKVLRAKSEVAVSLPLIVEQEGTMFNAPETVEFAAGQQEASFNITLNESALGVHKLNISLGDDPQYVNPYSTTGYPIYSAVVEFFKWEKVCDAVFTSALPGATTRTPVLEKKAGASVYRLTNLYADGYHFEFELAADGESYMITNDMIIGTMSGYPVFLTGHVVDGVPVIGAFDGDASYSYFIKGVGMVISAYMMKLDGSASYGWKDEVVYFQ